MRKDIKTTNDLLQDDKNANVHTQQGAALVGKSLQMTGPVRSIVVDKNNKIIAGNLTAEQWAAISDKVVVIDTRGDELVVHRRVDMDLDSEDPDERERARLAAYFDNQTANISIQFKSDQIVEDLESGIDLRHVFSDEELTPHIGSIDVEPEQNDFGDFDETPVEVEGYMRFVFGPYKGQVRTETFERFDSLYRQIQTDTGELMLADILEVMFNAKD